MKIFIALLCLTTNITLHAAQIGEVQLPLQDSRHPTVDISCFIYWNNRKKLEMLLQRYPETINQGPVTVMDDCSTPLLHYAIKKNNRDAACLLIKYGANIHAQFKRFDPPLIYAAYLNRKKIILLLIENQVDLELRNAHGLTALMAAAYSNMYSMVSMLIAAGANKNAQNTHDHHKTAFDYAAARSTIYNRKQFQNKYLAAIEAGEAQRNRYFAAQKIARKKIENFIPIKDIAKIVASYAYGQSPTDLPEQTGKNNLNCTIQ